MIIHYSIRSSSVIKSPTKQAYSRGQYKVSIAYDRTVLLKTLYVTICLEFETPGKCIIDRTRFFLLGMTQYYWYTRSEYRAVSSSTWIFSSVHRCCSSRLFLTRPFRSSPSIVSALSSRPFRSSTSIVSALLVARSASVCRLLMLFSSIY